jgi:hypothetical protein
MPSTVPLDTTPGFWVKPATTSSYVVKQEICSYTIWDTVVLKINQNNTRIAEQRAEFLKVFPMPAKDRLELKTEVPYWYQAMTRFSIINSLGEEMMNGVIDLSAGRFFIDISFLPDGVYTLAIFGDGKERIAKRVLISG